MDESSERRAVTAAPSHSALTQPQTHVKVVESGISLKREEEEEEEEDGDFLGFLRFRGRGRVRGSAERGEGREEKSPQREESSQGLVAFLFVFSYF